jgi:MOSC domain-containing protein YiiM
MRLVSVNVATPHILELAGRRHRTAIEKVPTLRAVQVGTGGLAGDRVASTRHHGGPDQAVYAYTTEDYAWWSSELGVALAPGTFGENLTVEGLASADLFIGDRLRVGPDVVLEVTSPRIPCATLAARMGDPQFVKRFACAGRPGPYLRVLAVGSLRAGDEVLLDLSNRSHLPILALAELYYDRKASAERLADALRAPIALRARADVEERLACALR